MRIRTRIGVAAALLVTAALTVPLWFPMARFIPDIERQASERLGHPVSIRKVSLRLLPVVALSVQGLRIGDGPMVSIEEVQVQPRLSSLWQDARIIDKVLILEPVVRPEVIELLRSTQPAGDGMPTTKLLVRRIEVSSLTLQLEAGRLTGLHGVIELDESIRIQRASVSMGGERFTATLTPATHGFNVAIAARDWTVPLGPSIRFDRLQATGELADTALRLPEITASLYGGNLSASIALSWQRGFRVQGNHQARQIDLESLQGDLKRTATLVGHLDASGRFRSQGATAEALRGALGLESDFEIRQGRLRGVDLMASVKNLLGGNARPGDTAFDLLRGRILRSPSNTRLQDLHIESGLLTGDGEVSITNDGRLEGDAKIALRSTAALIATPELAIAGTLDSPAVYPSKAAVAGAALGTALLGPGLGTSVGMKAAELAKRIARTPSRPVSRVEGAGRR